jgi:dTDP-4-amino-4,6-dideoxygalactose transaminase
VQVPFNKPYIAGRELDYIREAFERGHLSGNGTFTARCQAWLAEQLNGAKVLLTHSCTAALEMSALLADIQPGDEVIMPSYTFVSTANAFVLRGGVPVFVDIRPDTLCLNEALIEPAITEKTKAIVPVHYAGVGCEMDTIMSIAAKHGLMVIEDDAQGLNSTYRGRPLGSIGHLAALSFHETKNAISGEGGALIVNDRDPVLIERAEIIWEKGTNRSKFFRGQVDKYTWVDVGSSYLPSELNAAFLWAQLENVAFITQERLRIWQQYHAAFEALEREGRVRRPIIPADCEHNAHMYYLLANSLEERTALLAALKAAGLGAVFHYIPLHSSEPGRRFCRTGSDMTITDDMSDRLLRLPLWVGITEDIASRVVDVLTETLLASAVTTKTVVAR